METIEVQSKNPINNNSLIKTTPSNMVLGSFLSGTSYPANKIILTANGQKPCSRSAFFEKQAIVAPKVENLGIETTYDAMEESVALGHRRFSQDSRWSSKFNGMENTNSLFDVETGKLVSVFNTLKSRAGRETSFTSGSNMMESYGLEHIADQLQENFGDQMISICHDGDNKSPKIYQKAGLQVDHHRDGGHGLNSIKNAFKKFKSDFYTIFGKRPYGSLDERIFRYAGYLFAKVNDRDLRVTLWKNVPNHLVGDHSKCCHFQRSPGRPRSTPCSPNDFEIWKKGIEIPFYKDHLQNFFDDTADIIQECSYSFNTAKNESFNANIGFLVPKRIDFKSSYCARASIAIGRNNDSNFDEKVIDTICPNINPSSKNLLLQYQAERNQMKEARSNKNEKKRRKQKKYMRKKAAPKYEPGDYNENKSEIFNSYK